MLSMLRDVLSLTKTEFVIAFKNSNKFTNELGPLYLFYHQLQVRKFGYLKLRAKHLGD